MKQAILLLALCAFQTATDAQIQWLQSGQKWLYYKQIGWTFGPEQTALEVKGDTTILGKVCKQMRVYKPDSNPESQYFYAYEISDKVFWYNPSEQTFIKIYDFDMVEGETLSIPASGNIDLFTYQVDSVGTANLGDFNNVRFQKVSMMNSPGDFLTTFYVIEGIGMVDSLSSLSWLDALRHCGYFLPQTVRCDFPVDGVDVYLSCFRQGGQRFVGLGNECLIVSAAEPLLATRSAISPNPVTEICRFFHPEPTTIRSLTLRNGVGQTLIQWEAAPDALDLSGLLPGIYLLCVAYRDGLGETLKVVKL